MVAHGIRSFAAGVVVIAACAAHADEAPCGSIPALSANPSLAPGHIASGVVRVHFIKDATARAGCPSRTPACTERAYLVPGDRVILTATQEAFACAIFVNAKGGDRSGWLPADAVVLDKPAPITAAGWLGEWERIEAGIRVKPGKANTLLIEGEATYGGLDPGRVKRGAVNAGAIEGEVTPAGDRLSFAVGDSTIQPADRGDELSCKVWMQRVGPWLVVDDNNNCGGFNVTFRGIYSREP